MKRAMTKKLIAGFILLTILLTSVACGQGEKFADNTRDISPVFEYVYDAGTYTDLDYKFAEEYFNKEYNNWGGGCSAIAKTLENGETIVGRNMDLNISNKAAYIMRTKVEGCYETIGLAYTFRDISPDCSELTDCKISGDFEKILPFLADDVLNSEGLYVEVNMRNGESWATGEDKYSCQGTDPNSDTKVYMFSVGRYIGEHCATVDEAIEYVKTLDVYSKQGYWNYCFLLADATGHYGVLEFAMDEMFWNDYAPAQTNFYVDAFMNSFEELKCGVGRYNVLMAGIDEVSNEEEMFNLMDQVTYYQVYDPYSCKFDTRSENVGILPYATYAFTMDEANKDFVLTCSALNGHEVISLTREEQQNANSYWESSFTEVVNCNERTILVRFFENDEKVIKLSL